ncbi:LPXTG cell wall anchor domain-containing protein [Sphingomonas crocodyli]|uniref:LPXTG cell wall anchor domain-containing protein n=1 Tax=Sphingomonas crocodyli TaxID=1979270 RepID=A0A437LYB2_9SPHN|nr:LPXTG cell wall anchor domain-containing protein [Sphingomonas crocodyli]
MGDINASFLLALAAVLSSLSGLVWSWRRRP